MPVKSRAEFRDFSNLNSFNYRESAGHTGFWGFGVLGWVDGVGRMVGAWGGRVVG